MKSFPSKLCFLYNCGDKHHMLYFKIQISRDARQREFLSSKTGDKAGTWIKGLKKVSNNFTLPDRATFHSTIYMCLRQYIAEILPSCVNIYHTTTLFSLMSRSFRLNAVSLTCLDQAIVSLRVWFGEVG